ncbi:DnaA regulatory inactivator Hda [Coxiella burnetii]|uniref:DnaA regulatory inactivator Hda n=1 Tax=Coxiella burnetii TaxID=777 RepID=UPI000183CF1D|nr:DnaA regulatory inactivator Hda [Coxiella burnetii]ACJ17566.1 DnaA-related protein [Coxiella burnetii CbuG_Q212]ATN66036.1 DnaA regulatory inactivator Hda [Coxiella burnetii]OYK87030.1 DnaA regulatory inactivator Hda [Coxiella burnetii]
MIDQLPLRVQLREETTFANFYGGNNITLLKALNELLEGKGESFIYLWGEPSVGRTHLLQACCHTMNNRSLEAMYLALKTPQLAPSILQGLESKPLICIDDIDAVLSQPDWEEALLHFYNRVRESQVKLVIAGNYVPPQLNCQLADLRSRLSWGLVFQVIGLTDAEKIKALQMRAHDRGFELSDEVGQFLLRHYPRDMSALFNLLDKLDQASLIAQRKLTVPFVKEVLNISLPTSGKD